MGILSWILFGIVAGSVAKLVMDGPRAGGIAVAIPIGIFGALVGGSLNVIRFGGTAPNFDFNSLMTAIAGAMLMLFCYRSLALRASA